MGYQTLTAAPGKEVFTGARAELKVDGKTIGYATDCDASEEFSYEAIRAIDQLEVVEFVPVAYSVSFSAGYVRLLTHSLKSLAIFPKVGQTTGELITNVLARTPFTVVITDSKTSVPFMTLTKAFATSHRWRIAAGTIVSEDVDFVGIKMKDETE